MTRSHKFVAFAAALAFAIAPVSIADAQNRSSTPSYSAPSRPSTPSYSAPSRPSTPATTAPTPRRDPPAAPSASSGGYTRPSNATPPTAVAPSLPPATAQRAQPTQPPGNGFSRPAAIGVGAAAVGVGVVATTQPQPAAASETRREPQAPPAGITAAQSRAVSSSTLDAYRAERRSATQPPQPVARAEVRQNPTFGAARSSYNGNPDVYMRQRETEYRSYRDRNPEVFQTTQHMRPNYGIFDSSFLTGMMMGVLGTSLYDRATWMNAQQSQPWYPQYRADLERQARDNYELRNRIDEMDREMARIRRENTTPTYVTGLPMGVNPSIAIAPEAVIADAEEDSTWLDWLVWIVVVITIGVLGYVGYVIYLVHGKRRIR